MWKAKNGGSRETSIMEYLAVPFCAVRCPQFPCLPGTSCPLATALRLEVCQVREGLYRVDKDKHVECGIEGFGEALVCLAISVGD